MHSGFEALYLFLQPKFLPLKLPERRSVATGSIGLLLNLAVKVLVTGPKLADTGFDGHGSRLLAVGNQSEHPLRRAVRSHMIALGPA